MTTTDSAVANVCELDNNSRRQAASAFKAMLNVLRHPRCLNCHGAMNVYEENTSHPGGAQITEETDIFGKTEIIPLGAEACIMCHNMAEGKWVQKVNKNSPIQWANLSDKELWLRLQKARIIVDEASRHTAESTGKLLLSHVQHDFLIDLAFQGNRGMDSGSYMASIGIPQPDPPPMSKQELVEQLRLWIEALGADDTWPDPSCAQVLEESIDGCYWRAMGPGDIAYHDIGSSQGNKPEPARCTQKEAGLGSVCWTTGANGSGGPWCTYKDLPAADIKGGGNPGTLYECSCED